MSNSAGISLSFKTELLKGLHAFDTTVIRAATTPDTFYAALYYIGGSISASTTAYTTSYEVADSGYTTGTNLSTHYSPGGQSITNTAGQVVLSGTTACWTPSASVVWSTVNISLNFDTVLIYNNNPSLSKNAVANFNFGAQNVNGSFSITMPTNNSTSALIRLS